MELLALAKRTVAYFSLFFVVLLGKFHIEAEGAAGSVISLCVLVTLCSVIYIVYFIISEGYWQQIVGGVVISFILIALTAIFPLLGILLVLWVIGNLVASAISMFQLLPYALLSFVMYFFLFQAEFLSSASFGFSGLLIHVLQIRLPWLGSFSFDAADLVYLGIAAVFCARASRESPKAALYKIAVLWASIPLIALTLCAILYGLKSLFQQTLFSKRIDALQEVQAHTRSNGAVHVRSYLRGPAKPTTITWTETHVGPGAMHVSGANKLLDSVEEAAEDENA